MGLWEETILEQIVPYSHVLMTDPVAKVRAKALHVLGCALTAVTQLPISHAGLFVEYIFPQLTSMMSGMDNEPMVLLSVAQNLGVLATQSLRFAELAVAARPTAQAGNTPKAE
ncbi:PIK3R4, partial [Symbiodinium sp. CCMP2456]